MVMFTVNAMIHSLGAQDEAVILHEKGNNDVTYWQTGTDVPNAGNMWHK